MRLREDAACVVLGAVLTVGAWAPDRAERPPLTGISHVAFRVGQTASARSFYGGLLGHPAEAAGSAAPGLRVSVNERQYLFLREGLAPGDDRLDHVALETADVGAMRRYLASRGVDVPAAVGRDESGNPAFTVRDPEGRAIELVQHESGRWPRTAPAAGSGGPGPLSRRMMHAGVLVGDLDAARRFYGDVLGLTETWRGSRSGTELSWTNMKVPNGDDYLEFMLYGELPPPDRRGSAHHVCLEVADVEQAKARLGERARRAAYARPLESRVGTNRKRQLNLFDPDGTRVELMEPRTVDGLPVPPSTAPPPAR